MKRISILIFIWISMVFLNIRYTLFIRISVWTI